MPKVVIDDILRPVRLFESGWSVSKIAEKLGVTKQAVSSRLRDYYSREGTLVDVILTKTCKVCGGEEVSLNQVPVTSLSKLSVKPIEKSSKHICSFCEENNIYKCTACGSIGFLGGGQFLPKPISEKNRRAKCRSCNREGARDWKKKNQDKSRKIYQRYHRKIRLSRSEKGLCTECGHENPTKFKTCQECRDKIKNRRKSTKDRLL